MRDSLLSDKNLKAFGAGASQVVVGTITACLVANLVFMLLMVSASVALQGLKHDIGGFFLLGAIIGMVMSALPAFLIMIVLTVAKARTWWAYAIGGLVTAALAASPLNWFSGHGKTSTTIMVLSMMAVAGMIGGIATWLALRRGWSSGDPPASARRSGARSSM